MLAGSPCHAGIHTPQLLRSCAGCSIKARLGDIGAGQIKLFPHADCFNLRACAEAKSEALLHSGQHTKGRAQTAEGSVSTGTLGPYTCSSSAHCSGASWHAQDSCSWLHVCAIGRQCGLGWAADKEGFWRRHGTRRTAVQQPLQQHRIKLRREGQARPPAWTTLLAVSRSRYDQLRGCCQL